MLFAQLLAVALLAFTLFRASTPDPKSVLAQRSGRIEVAGLEKPVEVITDIWGVPHIYASNSADLFFAQGWVAASDRLWQMEMWRRAGEGRLAEVLGESAIERDRFARLLRYRGDMDAEWNSYAPDAKAIIQSFVKGVNAYIANTRDRLPVEFQMMGFRPEPWTPEVCITRLAGYVMTGNASSEVSRAQLVAAVGAQRAAQLMPPDPPVPIEPAPGLDLKGIDERILEGSRAASAPFVSRQSRETDAGSNNWTIAGRRTVTGKPLLANDPHRTIALPSLRYMAHLVAPGWNVIGSGEPALPGIAVGHNERVAFGFTIFPADMQDLYVEETDSADPLRYKTTGGAWEKMKTLTEPIRVKGRTQPVLAELHFTRHGPVIFEDHAAHRAYALRWTGAEPGTAGYLASLSLDRAANWKEFRMALERWKLPPENLVYADLDGNIGEQSAGLVPRRNNWRGLLPVPGGSSSYEWDGFLSLDDLPHSYNPPEGFIATANNRTVAADEKKAIGYEWSAPDRVNRITEVLRGKPKVTVEDMERLQHDEVSLPAREFVKMLPVFAPAMLRAWDGNLSANSAPAALYEVTVRKLRPKVVRTMLPPNVPGNTARAIQSRISQAVWTAALAKLPEGERRSLFTQALDEAQADLRDRLGSDERAWRWGDLHKTPFNHPLSAEFDLEAPERGGDSTTPNATSFNNNYQQTAGASYREIFDLGDWDRSRAINVPGQSGQPGSPHYGDLLPLWAKGKYFPLAYTRKAVESVASEKLMLAPKQ
jgi:penicillin amidase